MRTISLIILLAVTFVACNDNDGTTADSLTGKGGSMARFAVTSTHLYSVDDESLHVFQIMESGALEKVNTVFLGSGVETVFAREHWLYFGTSEAMITYDITNPASPRYVSSYFHVVACDPVVVQDTLAFVTVRTSECRADNMNRLDIINIKIPEQPVLVSSYTLESPYGLGIDGNLLFICEGAHGLKVFDVSNPFNATLLKRYTDVHSFDVIPHDGVLILTGNDGVAQYDYSNSEAIKKLSMITVQE